MALSPNILNRRAARPATPYATGSVPQQPGVGPRVRTRDDLASGPRDPRSGGSYPYSTGSVPQRPGVGPVVKPPSKPAPQKPPLPFDPLYENQTSLLNRSYNDALAQF